MKIRRRFESVNEFCTFSTADAPRRENLDKLRKVHQNENGTFNEDYMPYTPTRWLGASSACEAANRVTHGWPEGAQRVKEQMESLEITAPMSVRRRRTRTDQGDELDVHRVYRGDLDHAWTARKRREVRSPVLVRLVAQVNLLADMEAEALFWRGAAIVKLADLLVDAGYNVEIVGAVATSKIARTPTDYCVTFPLKESTQPLDIEQLAGVVCNAGFHRLFGFRAYLGLAPMKMASPGDAHSDFTGTILEREFGNSEKTEGYPTFITPYRLPTKEAAEQWVRRCIEKLNQPQEGF